MKRALAAMPLLVLASSMLAQPPTPRKDLTAQFGVDIVSCPERLEGWPYEVVNLKDCSYPGLSALDTCQKWNNKQFSVPSGWEYGKNGRYGSATHLPAEHYTAQVGSKTVLYCAYSVNPGPNRYITHVIQREAPGGATCKKVDGFRFRCESALSKQTPQ